MFDVQHFSESYVRTSEKTTQKANIFWCGFSENECKGPVWKLGFICPSQHLISGGKESSLHLCPLRMCKGFFLFLPNDSWADPPRCHDPSLYLRTGCKNTITFEWPITVLFNLNDELKITCS